MSKPEGCVHIPCGKTPFTQAQVYLFLAAVGALLYLPLLGSYGPLDPTDSFFLESGRELVETGNYLVPLMNYKPWLDKPILYFWAVAGSYKLLGVTPFAGRLFGALSGICLGLVTYGFSNKFLKRSEAVCAALILLASPLASLISHACLTDMPLTLFMSAAAFALFHFDRTGVKQSWWLAFIALALAFLCKGPISVILVSATVAFFWLVSVKSPGELFERFFKLKPLKGLLVMLAINLPWYIAATVGTNGAFFRDFFITQNFGRMVGTVNHQQPFWFYLPILLGGFLPWSLVLLSQSHNLFKLWSRRQSLTPRQAFLLFCALWAVLELALFSAIKTKLPTYILPAAPALSVLMATAGCFWCRFAGRLNRFYPAGIALVFGVTAVGACFYAISNQSYLGFALRNSYCALLAGAVLSLVALVFALKRQTAAWLGTLLAANCLLTAILVPQGYLAMYEQKQKPFDLLVSKVLQEKGLLATVVREEPSLSYYSHERIACLRDPKEARLFESENQAHSSKFLLIPVEVLESSLTWFKGPLVLEGKSGRWSLFRLP
jgi:4-amino-4-deoxy-L-arabinose transferase-like glycosyltransferase